jgi:hypothetical protein
MLRFQIRDLLWLMVVVGILCAWWLHVQSIHAEHDRDLDEIHREILSSINVSQAEFDRIKAEFSNGSK